MGYESFIAKRYLTARRKQAFISVITVISTIGITIGVAALIIAIALITGFQRDVQDKILGASSHLMISGGYAGEDLSDYEAAAAKVRAVPGVESVSPVAYGWCLVQGALKTEPAVLKGMDLEAEAKIQPWLRSLESGTLPGPGAGPREGILLGSDLAFAIGAGIGDIITVATMSSKLGPLGLTIKPKRFQVAGTFSSGLYEFDSKTALVPLASARKYLGLGDRVSYLQVMIDDIFSADRYKVSLRDILPPVFITTWNELNQSLFSALKLEKNIIFLTIALIVIVAALNIIATLILMVMEKTRDIGILIAVGATPPGIRRIFFYQGAMIGIVGTALGTGLGLLWCLAANTFKLIRVPVDIYQISHIPFRIMPLDLLLIVGVSLAISLVSTLFPSHRAAKVDPVTALKYE